MDLDNYAVHPVEFPPYPDVFSPLSFLVLHIGTLFFLFGYLSIYLLTFIAFLLNFSARSAVKYRP